MFSYFIYSFDVKYLGCMEVFESRGMTVCEEALKKLKNSKKKSVKAILYINGDGLRVVDYETKGLLLDQTIEKVSFCAPDHNYERGFSYICRDGTTRRWICHGFMAVKETVSILSATPTTPSFVSLSIKIIVNVNFDRELALTVLYICFCLLVLVLLPFPNFQTQIGNIFFLLIGIFSFLKEYFHFSN